MDRKKMIIIGGSVIGALVLLLLIVFLVSKFKKTYYSYETVEEKILKATEKYYSKYPEMLPDSDGSHKLYYTALVDKELIKPLNEILKDGDSCSADIIVYKDGNNYSYNPFLKCGSSYTTKELYSQILKDNKVVEKGSGLYYDGSTYYFRGRSKQLNNYVSFGTLNAKKGTSYLWRIVSIDNENHVKLRLDVSNSDSSLKTVWDERYNDDKKSYVGYNTFDDSVLADKLVSLYEDNEILNDEEKSKLVSTNLCIGSRKLDDTTKDGSSDCSKLSEQKFFFGTLTPYEYMRASLDEKCTTMDSRSCSNDNFLADNQETEWTTVISDETSYQAYKFDGYTYEIETTKSRNKLYLVLNLNEFTFYKSGDGSLENPYMIKLSTPEK